MPIEAGTRLEHYEVTGSLGAGGMGEVYRARDTKLKRDVALKILPGQFANDAERLARFEREAQALAAINHPHIAAIYGLEHTDGMRFLVLELVEGPTLAERLNAGRMEVPEALRIATEIAEAMEASHEKGVIHRDLKPANVKLTSGGQVKVLDFGLAKAFGESQPTSDLANSPTMMTRETQAGVIFGTAAYMSPEQATDKPLDKRTDIWSFGVVLYEMLSGRRPFDGKTVSHIIVRVLEQDPDWKLLPPLPPGVREILERCLQKEPAHRLRDIRDVRVLLEAALSRPPEQTPISPGRFASRRAFIAQGAVGAALLGLGWFYLRRKPTSQPLDVLRMSFHPPDGLTVLNPVALSPGGNNIAFVASTPKGSPRLWVGSLESNTSRPLETTQDVAGVPFWSHDGRQIVYWSGGKLNKIDLTGAPPLMLCPLPSAMIGGFWTPDNRIVFASFGQPLQQVSSSGGQPVPLTTRTSTELMHLSPSLLRDGRHFVYLRVRLGSDSPGSNVYVGDLDSPPVADPGKPLLTDVARVLYGPTSDPKTGYLLYIHGTPGPTGGGTLMAQSVSDDGMTLSGDAAPIADDVVAASVSASKNHRLIFSQRSDGIAGFGVIPGLVHGQLAWMDRKGTVLERVLRPGWYRIPALSPDDKKVAIEVANIETQNLDVELLQFEGGVFSRFSFNKERDYTPVWSPDGSRILYAAERPDGIRWLEKPATGAGEERLVLRVGHPSVPSAWAKNGFLLSTDLIAPSEIRAVNSNLTLEDRKTVVLTNSDTNDINARFSPDGKFIVYASSESVRFQIWVRSFDPSNLGSPATASKWQISKGGALGGGAVWRGNEIFYISADQKMMSVQVTTEPVFQIKGEPQELFSTSPGVMFFDVSSDGKRFFMVVSSEASPTRYPFQLTFNWAEALSKP